MKKKYLSIGVSSNSLNQDKILVKNIASNFPGAMWVSILKDTNNQIEIHTSDVILNLIKTNNIEPKDVYLYCDENFIESSKALLKLGCIPFILTSFESPIFSRNFYRNLNNLKKLFKYKILFGGAINKEIDLNSEDLFFPSFSISNPTVISTDKKIEKYVLVMSNKYYSNHSSKLIYLLKSLRNLNPFYNHRFSFYHKSIQLYDKRLDIISYLSKKNKIQLYGKGWDDISNIPYKYRKTLESTNFINRIKPLSAGVFDKIIELSKFKFALCIENCSFTGYVTEKIIDALVSKSLPIYLGATDISKFIPNNCFVNLNTFPNFNDAFDYIESINESDYDKLILNGQKFLNSQDGYKFSYEYFSQNINKKLINEN
jgi:hypothetical protein